MEKKASLDFEMDKYVLALVNGERGYCSDIVGSLLGSGVSIKDIYVDVFTESLYQVGQLWQDNKISVAQEHLATSTTESLFSIMYPKLFAYQSKSAVRKAIVSCVANEFHQVGGKIVADIMELKSVNALFLGANTPVVDLLDMISREQPDILALSVAMTPNLPVISEVVDKISAGNFGKLDIIAGGRAFHTREFNSLFKGVKVLGNIEELEKYLEQ